MEVVPTLQGGYDATTAALSGDFKQSFRRPAVIRILQIEIGQRVGLMRIKAGRYQQEIWSEGT